MKVMKRSCPLVCVTHTQRLKTAVAASKHTAYHHACSTATAAFPGSPLRIGQNTRVNYL